MTRPFGDMATAVRLLTVVPVPGPDGVRPARWFGFVGWLFAGVGLGVAWAFDSLATGAVSGVPAGESGPLEAAGVAPSHALLAAAIVVTLWAALNGLLHWDGLADCADGMGVRGDAARKLAVMRESGIGAFGTVAIVLAMLLQVTALATLIETHTWWPIAAAPVLGRLSAASALVRFRPARNDGLGARYAGDESIVGHVLLTSALIPLVVWTPMLAHAVAAVIGFGIALLMPTPFVRILGGSTGDVAGASVILTETVVLLGGALAGGLL